ncbi:MAG: Gfo/Idh/MocA family protein [Methyloligellaceae bacterium]
MNIAIIGFGWWGRHMVKRLNGNRNFSVRLIVEPALEKHSDIKQEDLHVVADLDAALDDDTIDAIVLTTPNMFHEAQVCAAAAAGKHVLCEKPLGLTAASARRSVAACEKAGVVLGIGHERRFEPAIKRIYTMVNEGTLGTIMHAEAAFSHNKLIHVPAGDWRTTKATAPGAGITAMGIHLTDLYISMFGRVKTVQAITAKRALDWETGDVATVQLGFERGMTATLSAILHTPDFIRYHVFGTERWAEVRNNTHPDTPGGIAELVVQKTGDEPEIERYDWTDTVVANLDAFSAAIAGKAPYPIPTDQMIHNIEILEAVAQSAETRETIHL